MSTTNTPMIGAWHTFRDGTVGVIVGGEYAIGTTGECRIDPDRPEEVTARITIFDHSDPEERPMAGPLCYGYVEDTVPSSGSAWAGTWTKRRQLGDDWFVHLPGVRAPVGTVGLVSIRTRRGGESQAIAAVIQNTTISEIESYNPPPPDESDVDVLAGTWKRVGQDTWTVAVDGIVDLGVSRTCRVVSRGGRRQYVTVRGVEHVSLGVVGRPSAALSRRLRAMAAEAA